MNTDRRKRAEALKTYGTLRKAVAAGELDQFQDLNTSEAIILGLANQGVTTFIGIFGHGSTDLGEVMRVYEEAGVLKTVQVRHEVEASHAAAALRWHYGITPAVFTSIGPGALHALAGSLTPLSNGLGIYYLFGDETTHGEGPNMQQIPRREQELFLRLSGTMGPAYTLHTPEAIFTALKRGTSTVHNPAGEKPFYMLMPMNIQPLISRAVNLLEFPVRSTIPPQVCADDKAFEPAVRLLRNAERITVKTGGGARNVRSDTLKRFLDLTGAVYVHGPVIPGLLPSSDRRNMAVGGSKGSICGNFAMTECDLLVTIGARGVCQWDSSGTGFPKANNIISINTNLDDLAQYNRTLALPGDAERILTRLNSVLGAWTGKDSGTLNTWQETCAEKRREWEEFKKLRFETPALPDEKFGKILLTQPAAIKIAVDFADSIGAVKYFDAGDVQANGFQICCDEISGRTFTDTGASFMGFAVSALLASALVPEPDYPIAFTGDGSFMMNPQILIDAVEHGLKAMIILFDNRRMSAISSLQEAQYDNEYRTDDKVAVNYAGLASAVEGVTGFTAGGTPESLEEALRKASAIDGLSIVHVPVYYGNNELGGLGAFGKWNVGNWCADVQTEKHRIGL